MSVFKRRPGQTLGLRLDLLPEPDEARFVRAFLFDKDGAALVPAFVDLADLGSGIHVENSTSMQSVPQMVAKYQVYFDAARTELDDCEFLGGVDVYDLEELVPSQLPSDVSLTAEVKDVELAAVASDGGIIGELKDESLVAEIDEIEDVETAQKTTSVSAGIETPKLSAEIDDC